MPGHQAPEPALRPAPRGCARQGDAQGDVQGPALSALRPGRPAAGVLRPQPWAARDEDLCREVAGARGCRGLSHALAGRASQSKEDVPLLPKGGAVVKKIEMWEESRVSDFSEGFCMVAGEGCGGWAQGSR